MSGKKLLRGQPRGVEDSNVARRANALQHLRRERGLSIYVIFASGGTCIVQPEVTQGPYYIAGELNRRNVAEDQAGVPLFMDIQLIDTNTCEPLPNIYTDIWHCNATIRTSPSSLFISGVCSGVVESGNGNANDPGNINTTFLRGVQSSGDDGVVRFESIFPGHYAGRAVHIHVVTHPANETKILPIGTIAGMYDSHSSHVGQIFFDQDIITEVEKRSPYSTNTQSLTENADDDILQTEADTTDPLMEYVLLGESVSDGIFAWISIGVNAKRDDSLSPKGYWTEDGGEVNNDFEMSMAGMGDIAAALSSTSASAAATGSA
ncbi:extracellular dioxygenase [Aspergillus eucalypticola CBS 122712]|uniref:Extracellular dioxygenase n=1 Tax=Aspergillus eucalypticola (strain CBS 122712 / IBT 29274) TaxID=1448314 RepID=A0A317VMP7_ASPEC|nr:extracellular dioxygenase [Aspergillus eucalypticola CBS 122712]PWY75626.1 extracellular dioxygenase [Aspergillus eucalypticola CBS 122712]